MHMEWASCRWDMMGKHKTQYLNAAAGTVLYQPAQAQEGDFISLHYVCSSGTFKVGAEWKS